MTRVPLAASALKSVKGCRKCRRSSSCQPAVSVGIFLISRISASDVEQQVLALPGADHPQERVVLALLDRGVRQHEAFAQQLDQRPALAQKSDRFLDIAREAERQVVGAA